MSTLFTMKVPKIGKMSAASVQALSNNFAVLRDGGPDGRDQSYGASEIGAQFKVYDSDRRFVATICYNGRIIWEENPKPARAPRAKRVLFSGFTPKAGLGKHFRHSMVVVTNETGNGLPVDGARVRVTLATPLGVGYQIFDTPEAADDFIRQHTESKRQPEFWPGWGHWVDDSRALGRAIVGKVVLP